MKQGATGHDLTGITAGTGEQRSYVLGRLHERRKKQGERKDIVKEGTELGEKFAPSLGIHATAKEIAKQAGVGQGSAHSITSQIIPAKIMLSKLTDYRS